MNIPANGILQGPAAEYFRHVAEVERGANALRRIQKIDHDLEQLAHCKSVGAHSSNNCQFNPSIDQERLREWIITELKAERVTLVDEFNKHFAPVAKRARS